MPRGRPKKIKTDADKKGESRMKEYEKKQEKKEDNKKEISDNPGRVVIGIQKIEPGEWTKIYDR